MTWGGMCNTNTPLTSWQMALMGSLCDHALLPHTPKCSHFQVSTPSGDFFVAAVTVAVEPDDDSKPFLEFMVRGGRGGGGRGTGQPRSSKTGLPNAMEEQFERSGKGGR